MSSEDLLNEGSQLHRLSSSISPRRLRQATPIIIGATPLSRARSCEAHQQRHENPAFFEESEDRFWESAPKGRAQHPRRET